ncbi:major facilitator superfamily domain-containing protein [Plectosphaerella plurivora]|uniref:Major facilitator superfamily domain-containing protein n=1 Tax=Plectosphaerella plurivora TaxID=936078 RepID=A0A9P8VFY7_9PEZI|nr:major facilitator superfamily domain-containing protein [Plectosphaerella plurivora]
MSDSKNTKALEAPWAPVPAPTARTVAPSITGSGSDVEAARDDCTTVTDSSDVEPVDLGRLPWVCVAGSGMFLICTYGFMQAIGTIQSYMQLNQLNDYTTRDVGWIIGVYTSLSLLLVLIMGPVMDHYGPRLMAPAAAVLNIAMFFLLAECKTYWQFMLVLGLLGGIGAAATATVAVSTISKLFTHRHGTAMGCAFSASCLGGVFFPLILQNIFPRWGWVWSIRTLAFIVTGLMAGGCLCLLPAAELIKKAEASSDAVKKSTSMFPNFEPFKSLPFALTAIGFFLLEFAMFGINGLLPTFAVRAGFAENAGYTLIALSNGFSLLGRLLPGIVADYIGAFNVLLIMVPFTSIFTAALFVPLNTTTVGPFYAFACLWGFGSGSWLSVIPGTFRFRAVCIGKTCSPTDFGRYYGTATSMVSIAALTCISVAGQVLETFGHKAASGLFLAVVALGGISMFIAKSLLIGSFSKVMVKL